VQEEVLYAWTHAYSPAANQKALDSIAGEPAAYKISHMISRLFFRGIYFPPKKTWKWLRLIAQNRGPIYSVIKDSFTRWHGTRGPAKARDFDGRSTVVARPEPETTSAME
jgi:hypothetical protein